MGLQFGIHIMRGIPRNAVRRTCRSKARSYKAADAANTGDTCPWCPDMYGVRGDTPAGQAYYDSLFRLYASWGVDFVKMDDTSAPYHTDEIEAVRSAIDKCGRSIVYSLSPGETPHHAGRARRRPRQHVARVRRLLGRLERRWTTSSRWARSWQRLRRARPLAGRRHAAAGPSLPRQPPRRPRTAGRTSPTTSR